jgi:hypothetical protein
MCGSDISIQSSCARCGDPIHVRTEDRGRGLARVSPATTVVWYDFAYSGCAASSCCPTIAFFCQDDHLRHWLEAQALRRRGMGLSMSEALEVDGVVAASRRAARLLAPGSGCSLAVPGQDESRPLIPACYGGLAATLNSWSPHNRSDLRHRSCGAPRRRFGYIEPGAALWRPVGTQSPRPRFRRD